MKKEISCLDEIRQNMNTYIQQMNEVNSAIQTEKEKYSALEEQIRNYTDLDNEAGYLKLKKNIKTIEERIEFLELKKKALSRSESEIEADRAKFRQEQNRITSSVRDKVIEKAQELIDIMSGIRADYNEINELLDSWSATYREIPNVTRGFLNDDTGILIATDNFAKNISYRLNK